ncbi:hypothetical protein H072_9724 [Dactylellina haptotyla CBS 200.50]|uniref:Cwf19-like C-terminal domain-containing protein n=1 Tax=Dactylellina haptotyla (strain CBS 200.50) TaxID=1284197 RepID=S8A1X5_DACHA|nr:hypothetical protein H072_9724 [Dactylellina haptotyla CBS 200.50]
MESKSSRHGESRDRDHHDRKRHRERDDEEGERRHRHREHEDHEQTGDKHKSREGDSEDRHRRHRHHHRSSSSRHDRDCDDDRHRHHSSKRSRHSRHDDDDSRRRDRHKRDDKPDQIPKEDIEAESEGMWVEKTASPAPTVETSASKTVSDGPPLKRDAWMEESGIDVEYTQRGERKPKDISKTTKQLVKDYSLNVSSKELNTALREGISLDSYEPPKETGPSFTFGDGGSQWRMRKLKNVYARAEEEKRSVDDVGAEVFGDLKSFDEIREERIELDRRETYGRDRRDYKEHPTGDLYSQRNTKPRRSPSPPPKSPKIISTVNQPAPTVTKFIDQSALNKLRASLLKAQLRGDSKAAKLEAEYNLALAAFANQKEPEVVVLSAMDSRLLAGGGRSSEAKEVTSGRRKGKMEANEDISLDDMLREEKRTKGHVNEGRMFAERIAKDAKFDNDLEYMDENASKLATRIQKSEIDIKNMAINDFKRQQRILDSCPLCSQENRQPIAPVISLGTRVFLTLPTEPELSAGGATIVPIQHRTNTLECDDDEWEEIRNFMKCLIRMYHDRGQDVIFYENASAPQRKRHAAIEVIPLPLEQGELAPAFFKEAFLSADEEWSQHKPIIDTASLSRKSLGKQAFRRSMVKEAPYFHVWFEIDGGMGHIVENENKWPKGDLFAREVIGGMLDCEPDIIKRQGRWNKGKDRREDDFRRQWKKFDWTQVLLDG